MKALAKWLLGLALLVPASALAQAQMPAGHPAVGQPAAPSAPEQDAVLPAGELPPGTVHVRLVNEKGEPLPNADVKLGILFQKISEGEERKELHQRTDVNGAARFTGLTTGGDFQYRVTTRSGPAEYASDPIQLKGDMGVVVLLHVYPVTREITRFIGSRGYVYVETRDDVFVFDVLFRYVNNGNVSWVPDNVLMRLPAGFKAFKVGEQMDDARFEEAPGQGARLAGTFSPGQHSVSFRFQVPRQQETSASFAFGLPPQTAEIRFIAAAAPGMELDVTGFEEPQVDFSNGQRMVVTRRLATRESPVLGNFEATLRGIPTPGPGRWIAAAIAAALGLLGFAAFRGLVGQETQSELQQRDAERARQVLLDELVDLTRARRQELIGPGTFESARRSLVEALARIVASHPGLGRKGKKAGSGKKGKKGKNAGSSERIRPSGPASTA